MLLKIMKTNSVYMLYALNPLLLIAIQWVFPFILTTIIVKYSNNLNINQHNTLNNTQNDSENIMYFTSIVR